MTQALNKALKMSSLLKAFNQIPLFMEMYWHDLKFCHFQKIISRLHSWPLRKLKKKKNLGEARISGELIYESIWKIMPAWKVKNSNFLVCMISLDRVKEKQATERILITHSCFLLESLWKNQEVMGGVLNCSLWAFTKESFYSLHICLNLLK